MKNLIKLIVLLATVCVAGAASVTPINRGKLQSNMDGNNYSITNLLTLRAGTVIAGEVVGGGGGLSNIVALKLVSGASLTNVTIKGGTFYGDGAGVSNVSAASTVAEGASLTNVTIKGGTIYADGRGITNMPVAGLFYTTNLGTAVATFGGFIEYRDYGTNAAFAWSGFAGVSSSNLQTVVYFITNSTAAVWNMTPPAGMLATNGTWNVTNVTAVTYVNNGMKWTNGASYPIK